MPTPIQTQPSAPSGTHPVYNPEDITRAMQQGAKTVTEAKEMLAAQGVQPNAYIGFISSSNKGESGAVIYPLKSSQPQQTQISPPTTPSQSTNPFGANYVKPTPTQQLTTSLQQSAPSNVYDISKATLYEKLVLGVGAITTTDFLGIGILGRTIFGGVPLSKSFEIAESQYAQARPTMTPINLAERLATQEGFLAGASILGATSLGAKILTPIFAGVTGYQTYRTIKEPTPENIFGLAVNVGLLGTSAALSFLKSSPKTISSGGGSTIFVDIIKPSGEVFHTEEAAASKGFNSISSNQKDSGIIVDISRPSNEPFSLSDWFRGLMPREEILSLGELKTSEKTGHPQMSQITDTSYLIKNQAKFTQSSPEIVKLDYGWFGKFKELQTLQPEIFKQVSVRGTAEVFPQEKIAEIYGVKAEKIITPEANIRWIDTVRTQERFGNPDYLNDIVKVNPTNPTFKTANDILGKPEIPSSAKEVETKGGNLLLDTKIETKQNIKMENLQVGKEQIQEPMLMSKTEQTQATLQKLEREGYIVKTSQAPQELSLLQINLLYQQSRMNQLSLQDQLSLNILGQKSATGQMQKSSQESLQLLNLKQSQSFKQSSGQLSLSAMGSMQKQSQVQDQLKMQLNPTLTQQQSFKGLSSMFLFASSKFKKEEKTKTPKFKEELKYEPSEIAVVFNLKLPASKFKESKELTGFEIRPMVEFPRLKKLSSFKF
jgi:hypothetical protein